MKGWISNGWSEEMMMRMAEDGLRRRKGYGIVGHKEEG